MATDFPDGMDAVFLPGALHGCEHQLYIIYHNESAYEGNGCWEIEVIDDRILALYEEVDGDAEKFFDNFPDLYQGEWYYCNRRTRPEDFAYYAAMYDQADRKIVQLCLSNDTGGGVPGAYHLVSLAKLLRGQHSSESLFWNSYKHNSLVTSSVLEAIRSNPEEWAIVFFDAHY